MNKQLIIGLLLVIPLLNAGAQHEKYPSAAKTEKALKALLKRPLVDLNQSIQITKTDSVIIERGFFYSEASEKVPILIYKPVSSKTQSFPVVICHHGTGGSKDDQNIRNILYRLTKINFIGVSIDARYHGERVNKNIGDQKNYYVEAIIEAWKNQDPSKQKHPFYFDTVFDIWRLTDYLVTRPDVQADRIGMMGISMGGIETWMAASVDKRIKVAVPAIAVQSFKWSLENNNWQGRANTIRGAHETVARDLKDSVVTKENVKQLWDKLLPGILDQFDCPSMLRLFAPRPLLLLNTEKDANCPLPGAKVAFASATKAYEDKNALDKLKIDVAPNEPHRFTPEHIDMAIGWFKKWL